MEEPVQVDKPCCQVDILPTVSNLLGLEYDSRMLSGRDILSDSEGLVIFTSRSWRSSAAYSSSAAGAGLGVEGCAGFFGWGAAPRTTSVSVRLSM